MTADDRDLAERFGPRKCAPGYAYHDWQLVDPEQEPPRTLCCAYCEKHAPPAPTDSDYELYMWQEDMRRTLQIFLPPVDGAS